MKQITTSAPGKLMLVGEHAVVYGYPCLVTAVNRKILVEVQKTDSQEIHLPSNSIFVKTAVSVFFQKYKIKSGLSINTESDFDSSLGLGSSSAVTVATIKALSILFKFNLSSSEIFALSLEVVKKVQGLSSGFDLAAAIYGGVIYYQIGKPIEKLPNRKMPLLVVYSGIKADTKTMIQKVTDFKKYNPKKTNEMLKCISGLVTKARQAYLDSDWELLGSIFNQNHQLLVELGVSTEKLNFLQQKALDNAAFGAKLSGAGGGDCMIALYKKENKQILIDAMVKNGGRILDVL